MKLIKEIKHNYCVDYIYENDIIKRIWNYGGIYWKKGFFMHKEDGPADRDWNYKYFHLNGSYKNLREFTEETNHILCINCFDFCNQKCFN